MDRYIFRGKRIDGGDWIQGNLVSGIFFYNETNNPVSYIMTADLIDDYDSWEDFTDDYGYYEVDPETIGQCTGLKDKNGTLIFEGDIIKLKSGAIGKVVGYDAHFRLNFSDSDNYNSLGAWAYEAHEPEVIGNIYDNSGLTETNT